METIMELLLQRSKTTSGTLHFLDDTGAVKRQMTYAQLAKKAQRFANVLLSLGLQGGGKDIVVTNFEDQETHILLFWACCFAGIPVCPTPPFHPDESRQALLLNHLQVLFHRPTFISHKQTLAVIEGLVPGFKVLDVEAVVGSSVTHEVVHESKIYPLPGYSGTDIAALMLTSGSTGNSKAVVLLHSKILSAVRGKTIKLDTLPEAVFLNWINFDHVANVTESHLHAVWAGASQYHVSPSAVIRNPRNLLDWFSKYRVTNSFSPNFLLAQICRDRTLGQPSDNLDLSSLRVIVTGGESNPVKTAMEFTDILEKFGAPRTTLKAAFGMTETGAGSIYNLRPIEKPLSAYTENAYLSVGTPCEGLEMRVVDTITSRICSPNTPGQLQVSGASVFSQYYANPTVTRDSFTPDGWFITGDFALIDDQGFLHMLGRDKDIINVNGVKHPCGDVERYIEDSDIKGIIRSYVFVCPMRLDEADTETFAVFYQHTDINPETFAAEGVQVKEIEEVLDSLRGIRNVCSIFCSQAPYVVLPLPPQYFVKTALGKVSRTGLMKAYEQGKFSVIEKSLNNAAAARKHQTSDSPRSIIDEAVCEGVAIVFEMEYSTIRLDQNLFDIGASSMHLIRLKQFLQERLDIRDIPTIEILKRPVIAELSVYIKRVSDITSGQPVAYNPLVCFTPHGSKSPLYLVHPGVGEVLIFINLARALDDDRPVYALRARGFEHGESPPTSLEEMADIYLAAIERNNPSGPYLIAGYSFGAVIAVEIAKRLENKGKMVQWVGILNIPPFIQFRVTELIWTETLLNLSMFLALFESKDFERFKGRLLDAYPNGFTDEEPEDSHKIIEWVYAHCNQRRLAELDIPPEAIHRWVNVAYMVSRTGRTYLPSDAVHKALTTVFCATPLPSMGTREEYKQERLSAWKDYSGKNFEMIDVDGEHYTMISEEHAESFALKMKSAIHRAESMANSV